MNNKNDKLVPVHPGVILSEEFLKPIGMSQNHLAVKIGVNARRINEIVLGKRGITANTAFRLAMYFGNTAKFWMGLQTDFDLAVEAGKLGDRLEHEVRPHAIYG